MKERIGLIVVCALCLVCAAAAQVPWINVPMVNGSAGQYACITRPTYNQTIAVITCNPQAVGMYPPFAQTFLFAHEHGHVYQIVYNPQMLMSPYAEYDADCYAATWLVSHDPQSLASSIQWFQQVLGPNGGDAIHGNGFQMAQRAEQCAQAADPSFSAELKTSTPRDSTPKFASGFLDEKTVSSRPVTSYPKPKDMSKTSGSEFPGVPAGAEPTACTAVEYLAESSHTSFWEASTSSGGVAPNISKALGASCKVTGALRRKVECSQEANVTPDLKSEVARCLSAKEWAKSCDDAKCTTTIYSHPSDGEEHVIVRVTTKTTGQALEMEAPAQTPHNHDSKDYASAK